MKKLLFKKIPILFAMAFLLSFPSVINAATLQKPGIFKVKEVKEKRAYLKWKRVKGAEGYIVT